MGDLKLIVFNVERGLCVFIRTPNGYGVMVDCGRTVNFSPVKWLIDNEMQTLVPWNGYALSRLIITHPHDDHVEDINNLVNRLPPAILTRQKDLDWNAVLNPSDGDPSLNAKEFYKWQQTYNQPVSEFPNFGLDIKLFSLSLKQAEDINPNLQNTINNSSYVTVITYNTSGGAWKFVIPGDNETEGWKKLLEQKDFVVAIENVCFFVTSHHGHDSGFCSDLYSAMGLPWLNISSEKSSDKNVCSNYSSPLYARGVKFDEGTRYHLTTRSDGSIIISVSDQGKCVVNQDNFGIN